MIPTDDELTELISAGENEYVEFKESLSDKSKICQAICAFANDLAGRGLPGIVVVGVDDKGQPTGLAITDELQRELADLRSNGNIHPFPSMAVAKRGFRGSDIAVVLVEPSLNPPVQFRGRAWIRVGPRRAIATPEEEARLIERRRLANLPFDARPLGSATVTDLDLDHFRNELLPQLVARDVLDANERSVEQQLMAANFLAPDGHATPTGLLFAGSDPLDHLSGAYAQFIRFEGMELSDPVLSEHRITGRLPQVITDLEEIVRSHIETAVSFAGVERDSRRPTVPFEAIQQLTRNALMHRGYEATNAPVRVLWFGDRVEVHSPGGPFGHVTIENFGTPGLVDYRNPTIAGILSQLGFVQRFGVGLPVARERLDRNGNPPMQVSPTPDWIQITVELVR